MAMTLRPDPGDEDAIMRLATRWGISKHQAVLRAVHAADDGTSYFDRVDRAADVAEQRWGAVLDRLADA